MIKYGNKKTILLNHILSKLMITSFNKHTYIVYTMSYDISKHPTLYLIKM